MLKEKYKLFIKIIGFYKNKVLVSPSLGIVEKHKQQGHP